MKTPHLDIEIKNLENLSLTKNLTGLAKDALEEYKAIKSIIENNPIVSTPEKPVWVVDNNGEKFMLIADLGEKVVNGRCILIRKSHEEKFLKNEKFDYFISDVATPYTPKVNIEVTEDEAVKVEEFLKGLRNGR
jgi:hypothetical protein